jgi:phosphorylcholine metabolism protein LicD
VSNNNLDMHLMAGPEQVRQELPKEISMYPFPKCYNHYLTQKYSEYIKFVL